MGECEGGDGRSDKIRLDLLLAMEDLLAEPSGRARLNCCRGRTSELAADVSEVDIVEPDHCLLLALAVSETAPELVPTDASESVLFPTENSLAMDTADGILNAKMPRC